MHIDSNYNNSPLTHQDFDNALITHIAQQFQKTHSVDPTRDPTSLQRLREACERAKIELDSATETTIELPYLARDASGQPLHLNVHMTAAAFEELTQPLMQRTVAPTRRCLNDAGISAADIGWCSHFYFLYTLSHKV